MSFKQNYIVFDFETGGLSPANNPAVEIGLVVLNEKLEQIDQYDAIISKYDDRLVYQPKALEINGISFDLIEKEGQDIKVVIAALIAIFKKYKVGRYKPILVGHNIDEFDMGFFTQIFEHCKKSLMEFVAKTTYDTLQDARMCWALESMIPNYKLMTCCNMAGIELVGAHRSMADVYANADLFRYFVNRLRSSSSEEVKEVKFRDDFEI